MLIGMLLWACTASKNQTPPYPVVEASFDEGEHIECTDPALRSTSPMIEVSLGVEWDAQPPAGYSPVEGDWLGGEGVVVADLTGNGRLDIFIPTRDQNLYFTRDEHGVLRERTSTLPQQAYVAVGASAGDIEGDGDLDLVVLNLNHQNQLLINDGTGQFSPSMDTGFPQEFHYSPSAAWGDLNTDGMLELFVATSGRGPTEPPPWEGEMSFEVAGPNQRYTHFDNQLQSLGFPEFEPEPYSCCMALLDINKDGHQDVYAVNDFGLYVQPNMLLYGNSDGMLVHDEQSDLSIPMFGMGLAVADFNHDGFPDFVVTDWGKNWLLLSDGSGGWFDASMSRGFVATHPDQHVAWGTEIVDADNDGDLDIWVGFGQLNIPAEEQGSFDDIGLYNPRHQPDALYLQEESGQFVDVAAEWGIDRSTVTRGGVWADLNEDGFLDFVSTAVDGPVLTYMAQCDDSAWLEIELEQPGSNRFAVGAWVELWAGDTVHTRWVMNGVQLSSSAPFTLHFGLGTRETVEKIRVVWPDLTMSEWESVSTKQKIRITKQ